MRNLSVLIALAGILFVTPVFAEEKAAVSAEERTNVTKALKKLSKTTGRAITANNIQPSPIPGILQVTADSSVFYVSADGQYVIAGEILDVNKDPENWSVTEAAMRDLRLQLLSRIPEKDMIIFPATGPKIGTVTVYTDIDCSYCRKMHAQIKEYNDLGIEIRYLAFPRSGPGSKSFATAVTVWCSDDRQSALTEAKNGVELPAKTCTNPVAMEYELGKKIGITGTPTLIFSDGSRIPGYIKPQELKEILLENARQ